MDNNSDKDTLEQSVIDNIEKILAENEDLKDKLIRSYAESENIRKRFEKTIDETRVFAVTQLIKDLLNILDNLERAVRYIPEDFPQELDGFISGIRITKDEMEKLLTKFNVKKIETQTGTKFDHNKHQALSQIQVESQETGTIVEIVQEGYILHDRILRPALVIVAG